MRKCRCYKIEEEIDEKYPNCDWNLGDACREWRRRSTDLKDNGIEFELGSDKCYGCTCPTCGRMICVWCA